MRCCGTCFCFSRRAFLLRSSFSLSFCFSFSVWADNDACFRITFNTKPSTCSGEAPTKKSVLLLRKLNCDGICDIRRNVSVILLPYYPIVVQSPETAVQQSKTSHQIVRHLTLLKFQSLPDCSKSLISIPSFSIVLWYCVAVFVVIQNLLDHPPHNDNSRYTSRA